MTLWTDCQGEHHIGPITVELTRVVESQEQIATLSLVDQLEEQHLLEALLEASKPPKPPQPLHYLLASPFRYPPLAWGSRFGRRFEPSLFYGSLNLETALSEGAFYRFVFLSGLAQPFERPLVTQHTSFRVRGHGERGVNLTLLPFAQHAALLRSPNDYSTCQQLGSDMRAAGVQLFIFLSARDPRASALNGGIFDPAVLAGSQPSRFQSWTCYTTADQVKYLAAPGATGREQLVFERDSFLVQGRLPMPPG